MFGLPIPIPGTMWLCVGAFVAGLAAGAGSGYTAKGFVDRPIIADLKTDVANGKTELANSETRFKSFQAQIEQDRADANAEALKQKNIDLAKQAALSAELAKAKADRDSKSMALTEALKMADAQGMSAPLSPAVQAYVESVRRQQELAP